MKEIKDIDFLKILCGKWVFCFIMTVLGFYIHVKLSIGFFDLDDYTLSFFDRNITVVSTIEGMRCFKILYCGVALVGIFLTSFVFYRVVLERFLSGVRSNKIVEQEIHIPDFPWDEEKLQLIVGLKHNKFDLSQVKQPEYLIIPVPALYQNVLVTGTIGMGKTASVMYSFLKQAMFYQGSNPDKKAGMLILDVKGNFYEQVVKYAKECGRERDLVLIQMGGESKYNPLHKPDMEAVDIAERSRYVLDLFSGGAKKDGFWDGKAAAMMTECIRLMRLTNHGYVSLADINSLVTNQEFLENRIEKLYEMEDQISRFEFDACTNYFFNEFSSKAETTVATIKQCVTEMTTVFVSSEHVHDQFCPPAEELNFEGFEQVINSGKIVILAMNVAKYPKVAKTIAAYLKLDFQSEVQQRTEAGKERLNRDRPVFFISDEYQVFVTKNDAEFYGLSRESKCCSIVSSQSYNSILQTLGNKEAFSTLQQNLINKIWLRTDDKFTVETAQFLTGKEEKEKYSKNISESSADVKKSKVFGRLVSDKASVSESINVTTQRDFVFEEKVFTQTLELFKAICFTANEKGMNEPYLVHLLPYFESPIRDISIHSHTVDSEQEQEADETPLIIQFK